MLRRRGLAPRAHSEAQGVEAPQDAHLPVLRKELHTGKLFNVIGVRKNIVHRSSDLILQETYLAKHMQKHSDRPDKRPPVGMNQGGVPGTANTGPVGHGGGHGVGGQNNIGGQAASAASAAAAAGLPGLAGSAADAYWPKMDPYGVAAVGHERDYGLMDPRLNPHHRDMVDPRHQVH